MQLVWEDCGPSLTEADLDGFEERTGRRLPAPFRRYLREVANGGNVAGAIATFEVEEQGETTLHQLYGINHPAPYADLESLLTSPGDQLTDPRVLPIGSDDGGNPILIHIDIPPFGQVSFCDHESSQPLEQNLFRIADSFDEFISGLKLHPLPPDPPQTWRDRLRKRLRG